MKEEFLKYLFVGLQDYLAGGHSDLEGALKEIGYDMGKRMLILKNFRQESSLEALLYSVAFVLLPSFFETERLLEKSDTDENTYLLTENCPLMNRHVSLPAECSSFTCDAIFAGAIESILRASGFRADVTAHNVESVVHPDKIVYVIKVRTRDDAVVEL